MQRSDRPIHHASGQLQIIWGHYLRVSLSRKITHQQASHAGNKKLRTFAVVTLDLYFQKKKEGTVA